ncbi:hypothetical protein D1871_05615 [Nakamurella silvestris]|nr:hypothetical protein D1871_05615 [Nakamurella silvestris]
MTPVNKAVARALMVKNAAGRGADLATQVGTAVSRGYRSWSTPQAALKRKVRSARRRRGVWAAGATATGAFTAYQVATVVSTGVTPTLIATGLITVVLFVWCLLAVVRAVTDLRSRRRELAALAPELPARHPVAVEIRADIDRLTGYSDGLRGLVSMIGLDGDSPATRELRTDTLQAADAAENHLRRLADDHSSLRRVRRTAPAAARDSLEQAAKDLERQIRAGVAEYGDLVTAASATVGAGQMLRDQARPDGGELLSSTRERITALSLGMRELAGQGEEPGSG